MITFRLCPVYINMWHSAMTGGIQKVSKTFGMLLTFHEGLFLFFFFFALYVLVYFKAPILSWIKALPCYYCKTWKAGAELIRYALVSEGRQIECLYLGKASWNCVPLFKLGCHFDVCFYVPGILFCYYYSKQDTRKLNIVFKSQFHWGDYANQPYSFPSRLPPPWCIS